MSMMQKLMEINDEAVRLRAECEQLRSDQKTLQQICDYGRQRITELQAELDAARRDLQALCTTTLPPKPAGSGLLRDVSHYTEAAEVDTPVADDAPAEPVQVQGEHELPEGWQVVPLNEELRGGDEYHSGLNRYIRQIESEPQPVQVREGRWRTRNGEIRHVTPMPEARKKLFNQSRYSWYDAQHNQTWLPSGHYTLGGESQWDLLDYLGPIEPEPEVKSVQVREVTLSAYVVGDTMSPGALRIVWATEEWIEQSKFGIVHAMKDVMFLDQDRFTPEQFSLTLKFKN